MQTLDCGLVIEAFGAYQAAATNPPKLAFTLPTPKCPPTISLSAHFRVRNQKYMPSFFLSNNKIRISAYYKTNLFE